MNLQRGKSVNKTHYKEKIKSKPKSKRKNRHYEQEIQKSATLTYMR